MRERCAAVLKQAKANQLNHFEVDMSKFEDTTKFVVSIIKVRRIVGVEGRVILTLLSATSPRITGASHLTADGNISM